MIRSGLLALALGGLVAAEAPPSAKELAQRFDAAQARVATLQAPFTLTIRRAMLRTPTVTKGTVYLQGSDFVHFAFSPPEDLLLHLTPKALTSYSPQAGEGQQLKIGVIKNTDRRFLGLGQRLGDLSDYFQLDVLDGKPVAGTWEARLLPRAVAMRRRFQMVRIWVDRESYLPRQVIWVERGGDSWELELGHLQLNQALPAAVTGFAVPPGTPLRPEFSFFATRKK